MRNDSQNIILEKNENFAIRIVNLSKYLKTNKNEFIIANQITRSGTSIGANITEAEYAISGKEFLSKMYIAFKECAETKYWLKLLFKTGYISDSEYNSLSDDCVELLKILSAITKSKRENL